MKQKKVSFRICRSLPVFVIALILTGIIACAAVPVIETDVTAPASGCIFLGLEGKYISQVNDAIEMINEIRWGACEEGVWDPGNKTQKLTTADYVPIKWSGDLEYIARIRAAEAAVTIDHQRTNGRSIWGLYSPNGVRSTGEVLAWNWTEDMRKGIYQWYEEKSDWVNQTGGITGHYEAMINPRNRYVGLATFCSEDTKYYNCTAGEFSKNTNLSETPMSFTGACIQKLEVETSKIGSDAEISGVLGGEKGDTSPLALKTTVTYVDGSDTCTSSLAMLDSVTWSSAAPDIVSVASDGTATANYCGRAAITASAGNFSATAQFTVFHKEETIPGAAATCTTTGLTEGRKCSVCGKVLQEQQVVPAAGHSWNGWTVTLEATYDAEGEEQRVCSRDASHVEKRTIAKKIRPAETVPSGASSAGTGQAGSSGTSSDGAAVTPETEINEAAAPKAKTQERKILAMKSEDDPKGSTYGVLQAQMKKAKKTSITLKWKSVKGVKSYVVYGNKCGKKYKKLKTVKGTTFTQKKLKKGTYYKYVVVAVKDGKAIATSKTIHVATKGGKFGNTKTVKANPGKLSVKVGSTKKIKVTTQAASKKLKVKSHRKIAFESSNTNIATVTGSGVVTGVRSGTCYIYAYAQDGKMAKVKVSVR